MEPTLESQHVQLVRSLAVGALTEVFFALQEARTPVVVKRLHRHLVHDPGATAMFAHEVRLLECLSHPGIPGLLWQGRDLGRPVQVQRFHAGTPLDALVSRGVGPAASAALVLGLLDVLEHVHGACDVDGVALQVVHRDLGPPNVLVAPTGRVSLVDFGIATSRWRPDPDRGVLKGTRGYMAPEVITGEHPAEARSDLFVVGVLLFEAATGVRCFPGNAAASMTACVEGARPEAPLPPHLAGVIDRALHRDPAGRFATAAEMAQSLREAAARDGFDPSPAALQAALPPP